MPAQRDQSDPSLRQVAMRMRWAPLRRFGLRSLKGQIVGLFLGLLLVLQGAGFVATRQGIERNAEAALSAETGTGERVLIELLAEREERLSQAARVLAGDYGFRAAIASADAETLNDALLNHSARIGASVAVFTDAQFGVKSASRPDVAPFVAQGRAMLRKRPGPGERGDAAERGDTRAARVRDLSLAVLDDQAYQVVAVPVKAPLVIGWVMMGFALDEALLRNLEAIAQVRSVLMHRAPGAGWLVGLGTVPPADWGSLASQASGLDLSMQASVSLNGDIHRVRFVSLAGPADAQAVGVLLLRSLDEAVAPYRRLQWLLLLLNLGGVGVAVLSSVGVARRIAQPIEALQASAKRLGAGDYASPVLLGGSGGSAEVRQLASALESMRAQIQDRERQVQLLAFWDPMTSLPNLAQLRQMLQGLLTAESPCGAILMLDLDRFKHVNDVLGHAFGDRLMTEVANRLVQLQRSEALPGLLGRSGSDEFVFLMSGADLAAAEGYARLVKRCLEAPIHLESQVIDTGAGVGVALFPQHGCDAETLLGRAEIAMYAAKRQQSSVVLYDSRLDTASQDSLSLLSELRVAVATDQLRLYLQPKISVRTGAVLGAEALVRWQHPTRGMVPPMQFIPFAEQTGFICELTAWMLRAGIDSLRDWRLAGLPFKLSINLSTRDLLDQELPAKVARLLEGAEADASRLCLEITESAIMDDPQRALQTLDQLHAMGLHLSIDDFGTGYSSLAYLKRLPVDELKIDRSFVMSMETDPDDIKIVRSTIDLAHNLGMTVVAEGVETAQAWVLLDQLHCDEVQGYFVAKPMQAVDFQAWARAWQMPASVRLAAPPLRAEAAQLA